jgi:hypothetical protein
VDQLRLVCDIKFYHVALTEQQVRDYQLPRIPIKETETRRERFEDAYGEGAVELDALEAIRPGALARLVREALERCHDGTLRERTAERRAVVEREMARIRDAVVERYAWSLRCIRDERDAIARDITPRLELLRLRAQVLWSTMQREMREQAPKLDDARYQLPQADLPEDEPEALYESARSYMEQLAHYKAHQRRVVVRRGALSDYVAARCVRDEAASIPAAEVSADYRQWCAVQSVAAANPKAIVAQLETLGFVRTRTGRRGYLWRGLRLRAASDGAQAS